MQYILSLMLLISLTGCGKHETIQLNDNGSVVRSNIARIELLEANDALQDLRLNSLEGGLSLLEGRVAINEDNIDSNSGDIANLFDQVDDLEDDLQSLNRDLHRHVRQLQRADRATRRLIRREVSRIRRMLAREIRQRQLADNDLQSQIDDLDGSLDSLEARVALDEQIGVIAFLFLYNRIDNLESRIQANLNSLDNRLSSVENDIVIIKSNITSIGNTISGLQTQIDDVRSKLTSVVFPCGGNSGEVLLQTQDGLVAYFQSSSNKTISFNDTITVDAYTIPAHRECARDGFFSGRCIRSNFVGEHTIPAQTYTVGDTATIRTINRAYLSVLSDGHYRTTDGNSCNFEISSGELVLNGGPV